MFLISSRLIQPGAAVGPLNELLLQSFITLHWHQKLKFHLVRIDTVHDRYAFLGEDILDLPNARISGPYIHLVCAELLYDLAV